MDTNFDENHIDLSHSKYKIVRLINKIWKTDGIKEELLRDSQKRKSFGNVCSYSSRKK